ncbi:NAD(P)-binding domain-containing protein [Streptosporangium fragile]|uniref:NAD(P)-binding domain-containing protein n=1 Tax=Streptosporangium fragile TaxID=46186 RepID=A0ABP6IJQ5_9ACTN
MKIGLIGAGHIGGTLARLLSRAGHEVVVSNSRGPDTLRKLERELGGGAKAVTAEEAAAFGDVVVVSVPLGRYREVPTSVRDGATVIDTNNYYPQRDGAFPELDADRTTSSELLQAHLPQAHVVKAFNAIYWERLLNDGRAPGAADRLAIPISGDDERAKRVVAELIDQIGFDPVDVGGLADGGRRHQPGTPVYGADLTAAVVRERLGL